MTKATFNALGDHRLELKMFGFSSVAVNDLAQPNHTHSFWQLNICCGGIIELALGGRREILRDGDILILPPGCAHGLYYHRKHDLNSFSFKFSMHENLKTISSEAIIVRADSHTASIVSAVKAVYQGFFPEALRKWDIQFLVSSDADYQYVMEDLLFGIVHYYCLIRPGEKYNGELLFRMREIINQASGKPVTVKKLSKAMGYSEGHLLLLVRARTGHSTKQFIDLERIRIAKNYLQYSTLNVSELAERMGFADSVYFGKFFRKYTGESPSGFIRRQRTGLPQEVLAFKS